MAHAATRFQERDAMDEQARILHSGPAYRVRERRAAEGSTCVVVFEYWSPHPTMEGPVSSEDFFLKRGHSVIGVKPARNDWYQDDEIVDAIGAVRRAGEGRRLVGYGASMGGFGVINFADLLGLSDLVAVCPQYSNDPTRAPYEDRWLQEARSIAFRHDRIDTAPPITAGTLIYDPASVDGVHAANILRRHPLNSVRPFFAGHEVMRMLQQAGLYSDLLLSLVEGRYDAAGFARALRAGRRKSSACWLGVADALRRRGALEGGFRSIAEARRLGHPDPYIVDAAEGALHMAAGSPERAAALLAPWRTDPAWAGIVTWQASRWGVALPDPPQRTSGSLIALPKPAAKAASRWLPRWLGGS
jgi:hypothetical protein